MLFWEVERRSDKQQEFHLCKAYSLSLSMAYPVSQESFQNIIYLIFFYILWYMKSYILEFIDMFVAWVYGRESMKIGLKTASIERIIMPLTNDGSSISD